MAGLKFTGDVNCVSEIQLNLIKDVLQNNGFSKELIAIENVGKKGDNYVAAVKRIIAKRNDGSKFKMIAKIAPTIESTRKIMNANILFNVEITMYNEVLTKFEEYMKNGRLSSSDRFKVAKCYGFSSEAPNEIILLEDLCDSNFKMLDRLEPLSNESVKLVLKDLAIFHALSYVMRGRDPDVFGKMINKLPNMWALIHEIQHMKLWLEQLESDVMTVISDDKYNNLIKGIVVNFTLISKELHKINMESKYSVISHGDCWTNNILFQLENEKPVESCMIDYQISKAASPVEDIHYIIFICTNYENRSKHFNEWIDHYHTELDKSLTNFGLSVNRVYPREQLNADLKRHGKLIIGATIFMSNMMCRESEDIMDIKDNPDMGGTVEEMMENGDAFRIINVNEETKEHFRRGIKGCIDSALELGYI